MLFKFKLINYTYALFLNLVWDLLKISATTSHVYYVYSKFLKKFY